MVLPSGSQAPRPGRSTPAATDATTGAEPNDRGDVLLGWLTRVVLGLAVVAVLGIDTVTVGMATVSSQDQANTAAAAARDSYADHHNVQTALEAAQASAREGDTANVISSKGFSVSPTGTVTLELTRPIHTLVAHFLPVDGLKTATASGSAEPSTG